MQARFPPMFVIKSLQSLQNLNRHCMFKSCVSNTINMEGKLSTNENIK